MVLPGKVDGSRVYLPIDSKFPVEDYLRLEDAEADGNTVLIEESRKALERNLKNEAKKIREKYVNPPVTTEYAVMFLPTEGLYLQALQLDSFMAYAEQQRIMVAGPSNLAAFLNAINMGFKTLAVDAGAVDIRKLLEAVSDDMERFDALLAKASRKIKEADKAINEAMNRTEIIRRNINKLES